MPATAAIVESAIVGSAAITIRKITAPCPMPIQKMANGIQASGERERKKFRSGKSARRAPSTVPRIIPSGTPAATLSAYPVATRDKDASVSCNKLPLANSSRKPVTNAAGVGKNCSDKYPRALASHQIRSKVPNVSDG